MKIKFYYMLPCDSSLFTCFLTSKEHKDNSYLLSKRPNINDKKDQRIVRINSYTFLIILNELQCSPVFHRAFAVKIKESSSPLVISLMPNKFEFIDKTWGEIVRVLIWEQLEIDHMMSWLSTLGGAFSALGDYFEDRAEIARKISIQQMKLAFRLEDPGLIARCLLYFSIALIQKGNFRVAQRIIKTQYEFATASNDLRLTKMCLGIHSKLKYTHKMSRINRNTVKSQ